MEKNIQVLLEKQQGYNHLLFRRGFLFTSKKIEFNNCFPFYKSWNQSIVGNFNLYVHKDQKKFIFRKDNKIFILIGHAYNPWHDIKDEETVLEKCANAYENSIRTFIDEINNVSGVFTIIIIENEDVIAIQDSVGMMPVFYSEYLGDVFLSSHSQLIADLCGFEMDPQINKLIKASFYRIGIRHLPGIKSPFTEIKALTANTYLKLLPFRVIRFYPSENEIKIIEKREVLQKISEILKSSMQICAEKWDASISLTGGTDSKMTLAAGKGHYEKFKYFSFFSTSAEEKDAIAARHICDSLNLKHEIIEIPNNNNDIKDYELICSIINHNSGYIKIHKDQEMRKIAFLISKNIELEIKSHIAEIGRAFYYKKLGKAKMPSPLSPRHMSNLYKRNMFNRNILKYSDDAFKEFINVTKFGEKFKGNFDESDMFYWEHRMSQWAALVKQDFDISHETTVIYNNRKLLELFMNFELKDRINDIPQKDITEVMNSELFNLNISNENAMKNKKRIALERIFFQLNS
ncbi:hypothetical protein HU147_12520 [Planomicrobium chinense]|uniref:hypothetical protein n=1 Tax=Planococcus chinensis TaxID=272917 RepID=UPI001CC6870E|nr:hypothetical protein [Planococcus chinensis]MBZ5202044.1 hypothetical protein [Planococcus chinensis]